MQKCERELAMSERDVKTSHEKVRRMRDGHKNRMRGWSEELKRNREGSFPPSGYVIHVIFYISMGISGELRV